MGLIRKIASFLGLSAHDHDGKSKHHDSTTHSAREFPPAAAAAAENGAAASGVKIPIAVERPNLSPLLVPCEAGDGGVQGFKWYASRLRIDEDGDIADEFLEEVIPSPRSSVNEVSTAKLRTNYRTLPTAMTMRKQMIVADGNLRQSLEYNGRLQWV